MSDSLLKALHETQTGDGVEVVVIDLDFFDSLPDDEPGEIPTNCDRCGGELEEYYHFWGSITPYCYPCGRSYA